MDHKTDTRALAIAVVALIVAIVAALLALLAYDRTGSGTESDLDSMNSRVSPDSSVNQETVRPEGTDTTDATTVPQTQP